jgi:hypothetical protein
LAEYRVFTRSGQTLDLFRHIVTITRVNATGWIKFVNRQRTSRSTPGLAVADVKAPRSILGHTAPTIAVRLVNSGSAPVLITGCAAEVRWARRFPHVRPPVARPDHSAAIPLPVPAHDVVLLSRPEEAAGRTFPGERDCARGVAAGESDKFVVRLEPEEHGGGTDFAHALPGDDRLAYQLRLRIRYTTGGRRKHELRTPEIGIISPDNQLTFPSPSEIREFLDRFRRDVARLETEVDTALRGLGQPPLDWARLRAATGSATGSTGPAAELPAAVHQLRHTLVLSPAFFRPAPAVRAYRADLAAYCRALLTELPPQSALARRYAPAARHTLAALTDLAS